MLLPLLLVFPLAGTLWLSLGYRTPDRPAGWIGVGSIGLAAVVTAWLIAKFDGGVTHTILWSWVSVGSFTPAMGLYLDGLSLVMVGVITGVGFLIHWFAAWYMREDLAGGRGYARFFAYMNLFILSMLILVLGDNLLLLFLGWECVGLCSYLLIGYHYKDEANAWAAFKSFIMTRIGDVLFAIGLFILFITFDTLNIQTILERAPQVWSPGDTMAQLAALMLLGGAVGKSAQLPLQTWLPDAMAGPTPVSALIHAATMVTAGVYLIARMHTVFEVAPVVLTLVGVVGALTLLLAGFAALAQTDIKRVLAYSTMSQIGYMFLALGVGAWQAAIFHLMIHAFFKALLFLSSGSVIIACHHEQDMFRMGGLRKTLKLDYAAFLIGGGALAALPLVTAGFYSKDEILWLSFANGYPLLWLAGLFGAFLTAIYTFRMIFLTFHGEAKTEAQPGKGIAHHLPLIVLGILSTFMGAILFNLPLADVLPGGEAHAGGHSTKLILEILASLVAVVGVGIAAGLYLGSRERIARAANTSVGRALWRFWNEAWMFDRLYDVLFVRPYRAAGRLHATDWVNGLINGIPGLAIILNHRLSLMQNGQMRRYVSVLASAATLLVVFVVLW